MQQERSQLAETDSPQLRSVPRTSPYRPEIAPDAAKKRRAGNFWFVVASLVMRDFRIRYRNMSLGILWSLANPLIMMGVLTFVFKNVFPSTTVKFYPAFVLVGLIPYNFLSLGWTSGTVSLAFNAGLIKRVRMTREIIPVASVLAQSIHFLIQIGLLLIFVAIEIPITIHWLWIPSIILIELITICGLSLACSAFDVYVRDTRYIVDSICTVMFWLTPIFYPLEFIPQRFRLIYELNPIACVVISLRNVLIDVKPPSHVVMGMGWAVSLFVLLIGLTIFRWLKHDFGDYL